MSAPPAIIPRPANAELIESVRHWVHFDNLAETLTKQVLNARTMRNQFEEKVMKLLEAAGMKNAVLQINGATLQRTSKFKPNDLTWTFLEQQLHDYYKSRGKPDETSNVIDFMQKNRGGKTADYLKKATPPSPTAGKS